MPSDSLKKDDDDDDDDDVSDEEFLRRLDGVPSLDEGDWSAASVAFNEHR